MIARFLSVTALVMSLLAVGCHKATIESYRIPKEKDPEMPMAAGGAQPAADTNTGGGNAMANTAVPTVDGTGLSWTAPSDWKQQPTSAMRKGSYLVPGDGGEDGDLSITAFPGDVGGELANVNRWRGQVQLPPIAEADLDAQIVRVKHNGLEIAVVDLTSTGDKPHRILGAMVPFGGATWFIKLSGPDVVVGHAKPAFLDFLETVRPASADSASPAASPAPAAPAPATGDMGNMMASPPVPTATGADLGWSAPADWKPGPASTMRKGSYLVPGNGGEDGDLSITAFPGDVGGELANVNRWRGQVQLPPIAEADLATQVARSHHDGLQFGVVDVTGPSPNARRILGAMVPYSGATWFFKLSGPATVVGQAKPVFLTFLQSVKPARSAP